MLYYDLEPNFSECVTLKEFRLEEILFWSKNLLLDSEKLVVISKVVAHTSLRVNFHAQSEFLRLYFLTCTVPTLYLRQQRP